MARVLENKGGHKSAGDVSEGETGSVKVDSQGGVSEGESGSEE